ncbi:unnamed protein product, partial [marine sediment metagenome]
AKISGKLPTATVLVIGRGYMYGPLAQPLEEITDEKFLTVYGLGPKHLAKLRTVISAPENKIPATLRSGY